jgi:Tfp pilus assembly protein PilF
MRYPPTTRIILSVLILAAVIGCTFQTVLRNDFVNWDDQSEILENPDFNPVTVNGLLWNWSHTRLSLYMPLTYMVWAAVASAATRDPAGHLTATAFHALNLTLHLICSTLLFFLLLQLFRRVWPALIGALAFAVHPLQAEPVAWASGMYTVLSTSLSLAALIAYVAYATRSSLAEKKYIARLCFSAALGFYLLALFTKAASVSLPLAAGVIDLFILGRPLGRVVRSLWFWVLLGLPFIFLAKHFQDLSQIPSPPLWAKPAVALDAIGFYLRKIVLPMQLIPDYGHNPGWVMQHPAATAISAATAVAALLLAWVARRSASWITAGIGLLIAGISPYLGLTAFDFQYVSTVADRYAYFGLIGLAVLAAAIAVRSRVMAIALLALCCVWAVLTHQQVQRWRDTDTLFTYTLQVNPNSLVSHNVFGFLAAGQHQYAQAESHYLKALQIWPEDAMIQCNLGNLYFRSHPEMALERYSLAVKYQPNFVLYRNSLAAALARTGHPEQAYTQWQMALVQDPGYIDARNNLGDLLLNLGQASQAAEQYQQVLTLDPQNQHAHTCLQQLKGSNGK